MVSLTNRSRAACEVRQPPPGAVLGESGRHAAELFLQVQPYGHGIDPNVLTGQTGEEEFTAVLALEQGLKGIRHLESALVVDASRRVAPKHAQLLHFWPQKSTRIVEEAHVDVNRNL